MYVMHHMMKEPVTVRPETTLAKVRQILREHHFRHLPVVDAAGTLLGMVTDRDLRSAYPSTVVDEESYRREVSEVNTTPVSAIMSREVVSLERHATIDDALLLLDHQKVGALPIVTNERRVVGILSIRDLLQAYRKLFGLGEKGSALVAVRDDGKPRPLTRITEALEEKDIHFSRLVRTQAEPDEAQAIYIRVNTMNIHAVHGALQGAGFEIDPLVMAEESQE